ncbi:hypothetical protein GCM10011351_02430 [Paraliobacillus quinghaiensis]|uniref:FbpB family small basic protein n=1 Tax=Paraliobacillus quinghaiensis TaxID=470815 RepID=A0A917WNZ7_9BACI|nr:FbpB family small basic protein [Paraliobacillus quinghaiensis]GGM20097.1 hypothetical protein GCM10011351_02430 [Paraliobacillus quinghaiensis]
MRVRKVTFEELVNQNKQELLNDKLAMEKLEENLDERQTTLTEQKQNYVN